MVKFEEDGAVCIVPVKTIKEPSPSTLKELTKCTVKWSSKKDYTSIVMAMGK